jgi:tetratricopeptide (TPR) repeat protein
VGIIFVALILNSLTNQETKTSGSNPSNLVKPFDRLPADQQDIVRQAYSAAQLLLAQGRYELTKQELAKIHRLIPFYEDSKQMEETADQGLLIAQERERLAAEERERAEINDKIQAQLMQCQSLLRPEVTLEEFESCVLPVLQFDPEHSAIREMRDRVIGFIAERESRAARQREHAGRVRALHELFKRAEQIEKEGRAIPTINAYRRVVTSRLPDPNGLKRLASEKIKEVSAQLESLQAKSEQESEEARKAGNYRRAILIIREALKFNPENEVLKSRHVQLMKELTNLMMTLYQEGVLEESIGNVEAAKAQWQKIRTQSLAGEEYFVRATIKLQRYGAIRDEF